MENSIRKELLEKLTVSVEVAGKAFGLSKNLHMRPARVVRFPASRSVDELSSQPRRFAKCSELRRRPHSSWLPETRKPLSMGMLAASGNWISLAA